MTRANCDACDHFKSAPYEARIDGCFHPDHMKVTQKDAYLNEQETPGDHRVINRRGDCDKFEPKEQERSLLSRILSD
jgi:hypothetical protein